MNNPTSNNKGIREEFNKIGEGSVRFIATRGEVYDFFISHFSSELQALEEKMDGMRKEIPLGLTPEEHEEVRAFNSVYNKARTDVLTLILELKEKYKA